MRAALVLLALLLVTPAGSAQGGAVATLRLEVQEDHTERGTLTFEGLKGLTRYEGICLPERARETRVYDDLGDVDHTAKDENGRRTLSFLARSDKVMVDLTRTAPSDKDHPLYANDVNFCVPTGSRVLIEVGVPAGHTLFFMTDGEASGRKASSRADGPTHVFYSYEAPVGSKKPMMLLEVEPFRVFAPTPLAPQAEELARAAAGPFRAALDEAGIEMPFDAMRVLFVPQTPFAWEAGHYNGHGYVQVKEDVLSGDRTQGYPIAGARVLVHEAFHGASFAQGKGPVEDEIAWWLEGTAKRSERHVDASMPNATLHCEKSATEVRCWDFDDRIKRADVERGYDPAFRFNADWEPSAPQDDETRRFYYSYSEYVVSAWIERHGRDDYRRVWDDVAAAFDGAGCPCGDGWLESLLDDPDLFRPWQDVKAQEPAEFDAIVKPYVKDEEAAKRELSKQTNPFSGVPVPAWVALVGVVAAAALARRS